MINTLNKLYNGAAMSVFSRHAPGTNIYDREWDLLIILDACRIDALREVASEYDFLGPISSHMSQGSSSPEFMAANFTREYINEVQETAYISGNAHSEFVFENRRFPEKQKEAYFSATDWKTVHGSDFGLLDHVWRYTERMDAGPCDPANLIDRAVRVGREDDFDRTIVHFHQPHAPYVSHPSRKGREPTEVEKDPFKAAREGRKEEVWEAYLNEIRYILDQLPTLLENFDAERAVISADHGELFGKYLYSHPSGLLHPKLRWVPWAYVSTEDTMTYEPTVERSNEVVHPASQRLKELGYIE